MSKSHLRRAAQHVEVNTFRHYKDFLASIFNFLKIHEKNYSYGQFAEDLGFNRSNVLWLVITGRRRLTSLTTERVVDGLGLKGDDRRYFVLLVKHNNARDVSEREKYLEQLLALKAEELPSTEERQKLEYFAEWYYPVIRELVLLPNFRADEAWIASQLYGRLLPKEIQRSIELLQEIGLIKLDISTGRFVQSGDQIKPNRMVERLAGIRYHEAILDIAKESINSVEPERRDYNALTICVSDDTARRMKGMIYDFCVKIMELEDKKDSNANQIYQLNLQLFPFTKKSQP